jgi:hypothetical protein
MKRKLAALASAIVLLLTFAPAVSAGTQNSCSPSDNFKVLLFENVSTSHVDGDDTMWWCSAQASDLGNAAHNLSGMCYFKLPGLPDNWNDCIDSVSVWLPSSSYRMCFYGYANYGGPVELSIVGPKTGQRYDVSSVYRDSMSSFTWRYLQVC